MSISKDEYLAIAMPAAFLSEDPITPYTSVRARDMRLVDYDKVCW